MLDITSILEYQKTKVDLLNLCVLRKNHRIEVEFFARPSLFHYPDFSAIMIMAFISGIVDDVSVSVFSRSKVIMEGDFYVIPCSLPFHASVTAGAVGS